MRNGFRLRSSAAMVALAVGMTASPAPAHAFLGSIVKSIIGGGAGGGGGCSSGGDGIGEIITGVVTGNPALIISGANKALGGSLDGAPSLVEGEDKLGGCPIIETEPLAMQTMTEEMRDELMAQGEELIRMNSPTTADLSGDLVGGVLAGGDQSTAVGLEWSPDAADARYSEQYPETYQGMMPDQMRAHGDMQAKEARDAARTSKRTTSAAVSDILKNVPTELDTLLADLRNCEGINCSVQVGAQIEALGVKVNAMGILMDAGHYRANESFTDTLFSARERAIQDQRLNNGEIGTPIGTEAPIETPGFPDEEIIFDPTQPVS